jgi:iron complex outermembrane recepter protein
MKGKTLSPCTTKASSLALLKITLLVLLTSINTLAYAEPRPKQYHIPVGSLATALNSLAETSDLQVVYDTPLTQGINSKGLSGVYSADAALQRLVAGTGLTYTVANGTVTIEKGATQAKPRPVATKPEAQNPPPESSGTDTTLPKVTVEADVEYDPDYYTDPYNKDYAIPNATAGTKTDTPIMETPLNVQVISKQVLKDQQVITLDQALKNVSGVTTNATGFNGGGILGGGASQSIFLRGFQADTFFRNGFRLQDGSASRGMANVESVEVLKGSAAILYGLVEPGGMVNVITKQPLATPYYGFNQQFGSYDLYRTTVDATGPITKNKDLLYRMNLSYENSGSFRDFVNKEDVFLAPVLKWVISPKTQATFELEYNHQHLGLDNGYIPLFNGQPVNLPRSVNFVEYSPSTRETVFVGFNWSHQFNDDWVIKNRFSVNQQMFNSYSVIPYGGVDANGKISRYLQDFKTQNNTYSTSLDLTGHFDTVGLKHTLLIGGDYYRLNVFGAYSAVVNHSTIDFPNPNHPGMPEVSFLTFGDPFSTQSDQYGLYIQDQIKLPYDVHIMGGIRYQYLHQNSDIFGTTSAQTNDAVTPRVGFLWQPQSWISLYANYVESFGPNTGNVFISPTESKPVAPTSAGQCEGGIKTEFFGGRLRATLAYYDLTKTNIATPDRSHLGFSIITGAARSRGSELDIQGEILPGWNIIATYTNTDARVTKSNTDFPDSINPTVGSRLFNVPRNSGSLWSTYEVQDGDLRGFKFGSGVTLRDGQTACCDTPAAKTHGYATVDMLAAYSRDVGKTKITAQLNINNLLDKHYFTGLQTNGAELTGFQQGGVDFGQPRTFMGSISIQY